MVVSTASMAIQSKSLHCCRATRIQCLYVVLAVRGIFDCHGRTYFRFFLECPAEI
ncbi:hypothetical protein DSUL_50330 [Desulfovibrionales bacterium]